LLARLEPGEQSQLVALLQKALTDATEPTPNLTKEENQ
jgi:hypothetical protein